MKSIIYDEAIDIVKDVKNGKTHKVFCIVIVEDGCKFCEDMMKNVMVEVEETFKENVDFAKLDISNEKSDNMIFPVFETPTFLFYVHGGTPFPAYRKGIASLENVKKDFAKIISVNEGLNGTHT